MKKTSIFMLLLLLAGSLQAQQVGSLANGNKAKASYTAKPAAKASLKWEATSHDFGQIRQGVPVSNTFSFTNTSDKPLLITQVKAPCGCTVTTYSKEAIAPGQQGYVSVSYNAAHPGVFRKTVTVSVNTQPGDMVLSLQGTVLAKEGR